MKFYAVFTEKGTDKDPCSRDLTVNLKYEFHYMMG